MKTFKILAWLLVLLPTIAIASDNIKTIVIQTNISCDHCKQCESCSGRIEKALYSKKGIKRVDIEEAAMQIKVAYNTEKINVDDIRKTIASAGYNADDVKAAPEAVAALDDCCKGGENSQ